MYLVSSLNDLEKTPPQMTTTLTQRIAERLQTKTPDASYTLVFAGPNKVVRLNLPNTNPLKNYLRDFPLYDLFVPCLASVISKTIIDIGANTGDTYAMIRAMADNRIIAVEPDPEFARLFRHNGKQYDEQVELYPYFVSAQPGFGFIEKNDMESTGNVVRTESASPNGAAMKSFSEFASRFKLRPDDIGLIKIDTDGFDWDCLNSVGQWLNETPEIPQSRLPFVFYEHQTFLNNKGPFDASRPQRSQDFLNALRALRAHQYDHYLVFDNFGTLICQTDDLNTVHQLSEYVARSQCVNGHSTFYFVDVLAYPAALQAKANEAVSVYLKRPVHVATLP